MRTISLSLPIPAAATTATGTLGIGGEVSRVYAVLPIYDSGAPGTTTWTITDKGRQIFSVPAANVSRLYPVLEQAYDQTGIAIAAGQSPRYVQPVVVGPLQIVVANALAGTGYQLQIYLLED